MEEYEIQRSLDILERYLDLDFISTSVFEFVQDLVNKTTNNQYGEGDSPYEDKNMLSISDKKKILNFFVRYAQNKHLNNSDLMPSFSHIFANALSDGDEKENLSRQEKSAYVKAMFHKNRTFMMRRSSELLAKVPTMAETMYECLGEFPENSYNDRKPYCRVLNDICKAADPEFTFKILKDIYENPENKELQSEFYTYLGEIYKDPTKSALQSYIYALMKKGTGVDRSYYLNLRVALENGVDPKEILRGVDKGIDKASDTASLLVAYALLGEDIPKKAPELKEEAQSIIRRALENNRNNNKTTRRKADIYLENWDNLRGGAIIGQRVEKSDKYPHAWKSDIEINQAKPAILCLCGDGTLNEKEANGYAKSVEKLLENNGLNGRADIYAAAYDFGCNEGGYILGSNPGCSRTQMFKDYKHLREVKSAVFQPTPEDKNPKYVADLFEKFFLPRISKNDGKERLSLNEAKHNIRNLQVVAHCHGAYTALKIEEMMQKKMAELGYSKDERAQIQKELLIVAQSPYCPLGVSKSTFISFCSAKDAELNHHNHFNDAVWEINQEHDIKLSYFDEKKGNLFLVSTTGIGEYAPDEHNYWGLEPCEGMDKQFAAALTMECSAIVNSLKNALDGGNIPTTKELVCNSKIAEEVFDKAVRNGDELYAQIVQKSRKTARAKKAAKKFGEMEY